MPGDSIYTTILMALELFDKLAIFLVPNVDLGVLCLESANRYLRVSQLHYLRYH